MNKYSKTLTYDEENREWIAECPELGGVSAIYDTEEESLKNLNMLIDLAVEDYIPCVRLISKERNSHVLSRNN